MRMILCRMYEECVQQLEHPYYLQMTYFLYSSPAHDNLCTRDSSCLATSELSTRGTVVSNKRGILVILTCLTHVFLTCHQEHLTYFATLYYSQMYAIALL